MAELYIIDFDKTLINIDSFRAYQEIFRKSRLHNIIADILSITAYLKLIPLVQYKMLVLKYCTTNYDAKIFNSFLLLHVNEKVLRYLNNSKEIEYMVISASPQYYLVEFINNCLKIYCLVSGSAFDGDTVVHPYKHDKVKALEKKYPSYRDFNVTVFTDSLSDRALLDIADKIYLTKTAPNLIKYVEALSKPYRIL